MKKLWSDRRLFLATLGVAGLLLIMDKHDKDYSTEVVGIVMAIAGANVYEKVKAKKDDVQPQA